MIPTVKIFKRIRINISHLVLFKVHQINSLLLYEVEKLMIILNMIVS